MKESRTQKPMNWFILDGPLHDHWLEGMGELLDPASRHYGLFSGEMLLLPSCFNILCETTSLDSASPSFVCRMGLVHVHSKVPLLAPTSVLVARVSPLVYSSYLNSLYQLYFDHWPSFVPHVYLYIYVSYTSPFNCLPGGVWIRHTVFLVGNASAATACV